MECIECGFNNSCVNLDNELCPECNETIKDYCLNCDIPCRTEPEREVLKKLVKENIEKNIIYNGHRYVFK